MLKEKAVASLGQPSLLMPAWIKSALAANDPLKLYLTLLQSAVQHAFTLDAPAGQWDKGLARTELQDAPWAQELVPGMALPNEAIKVIVRSDGSGTTYNFADYLGKVSSKWKSAYDAKTSIQWPSGFMGAKGSDGVARALQETPGSIAYIDHGYVKEYGLATARMKNAEGEFVRPSVGAFKAALVNSEWATSGAFSETLTQKPGKGSWPITMGTFIVVPKVASNPEQTLAALKFFAWVFLNGDTLVQENNFVRLPDRVQAAAFKAITSVKDKSGTPIGMTLISSLLGGK